MSPRVSLLLCQFLYAIVVLVAVAGSRSRSIAQDAKQAPATVPQQKVSEVVLKKHCVRCHGEKTQEARLRVDRLDRDFLSGKDADVWHEVLNKVTGGEMPPEDEPPLSTAERKALVEWIRGGLKAAAEHRRSTGGQVVIRRLTRYEYQHTMEDLLDLAMDFSSDLPEEAISQDGFLNNGQTLLMSPIQMETYLQVARRALDIRLGIAARENESSNGGKSQQNWLFHIDSYAERQALLAKTKPAPPPPVNPKKKPKKKRPAKAKDGMQQRDIGQNTGGRDGIYVNPLSVEEFEKRRSTGRPFEPVTIKPNFRQVYTLTGWPLEGEILVRVRVAAGSTGSPKMTALVGFRASGAVMTMKSIGSGLVTGSPDEPQTFEFRARMENLPVFLTGKEKFKGEHLAISNDSISADLLLDSVEFICPAPRRRDFESAFLDRHAGDTNTRYALRVLHRFTRVAWRRPVTREELERLVELYEDIAERSGRHDIALRDTLAAVLSSPNFLYLAEPATEDAAKGNSLTDHELAARLSYFLWSTMPDRELRGLADVHQLRNEEMLAKQTRRLLADPRSERFVRNFTYQWLDLNGLARVAVNPEYFPKYDDDLKSASAEETYAFFREVLRSELPVTTFLQSDFAMLNDRMAAHYSIDGVGGSRFRRVPLGEDSQRGGLLTHASLLTANSTGVESHPIKRGVWLLKQLFNDPPPPPPPNVPALDEEQQIATGTPIRELLKQHRSKAACFDCHQKIDPWGLAFENYDAIGQWRTNYSRGKSRGKGKPIEIATSLPGEIEVTNLRQVQQHLTEEKADEFARAFCEDVLSYALGRSLEFTDEETVTALTEGFKKDGLKIHKLLERVVLSEAFQTK